MHPYLNTAFKAVRKASRVILDANERRDTIEVTKKGEKDFVTNVDHKVEEILVNEIHRAYPDHGIIAEESGLLTDQKEIMWIIDPLDGTNNFVHGLPQFAISIAVQIRGVLEHALIYDPMREELFTADRGQGAQLNNRRIRVKAKTDINNALVGTGFPFRHRHRFEPYLKTFSTIYPLVKDIRRLGAASLDLAYVACGRLDGFWEFGLAPWDIAAGALIIQEAGGMVSDLRGGDTFMKTGDILAGSPKVYTSLHQALRA